MRPEHWAMVGGLVLIAVLAVRTLWAIWNETHGHHDIDDLIDWEGRWGK